MASSPSSCLSHTRRPLSFDCYSWQIPGDRSARLWCSEMVTRVTAEEMLASLKNHFERRRDIGLWNWFVNGAFYLPNPFNTEARRFPRPGFIFSAGLFAFAAAWFSYFNFAR